nr:hypothetical protein [Clostridia bacterium]
YLDDYYKHRKKYKELFDINIKEIDLNIIIDEIKYLFSSLKSNIITAKKLYSRLSIINKELINRYDLYGNPNKLFILCSIYINDFYYSQPFICLEKEAKMTNLDVIVKFIYENSEFTISDINNYINKMHLKRIRLYQEIIEEIGDDYVQINKEKYISKDIFNIDEEQLEQIKDELSFYINTKKILNSDDYRGYMMLPNLDYEWNEFLLLGIVRTYLKQSFKIIYKGKYTINEGYLLLDIKDKII